jgi:hypothetical protein
MVFESTRTQDYECLNAVNTDDYEAFRSLDGTSRKETWKPIVVRCVRADKRHKKLFSDFPWLLGEGLCFREKAAEILKDMLEKHGELLPLITEDGENLYVHNTLAGGGAKNAPKLLLLYCSLTTATGIFLANSV